MKTEWPGLQYFLLIGLNTCSVLTAQFGVTRDGTNEIRPVVLSIAYLWRNCSYLLFTDGETSGYEALAKDMAQSLELRGAALFDNSAEGTSDNFTVSDRITSVAREVRLHFLCVVVVVVSDRLIFLESFAESSLRGRLLSGTSTLIAVGRLRPQDVEALSAHWTFSMYNALVFAPESPDGTSSNGKSSSGSSKRWNMYYHMPFTASGGRWIKLGYWLRSRGLILQEDRPLLPQKFSNLYGATVNISALPYKPYWMEETNSKGDIIYSGSDKLMLDAMESTLNFTMRALKVSTWDEVVQRVLERKAWTAPIIHAVYPARLKRFDFTRTYEHDINQAFVMAKPVLKPQWQSLYYPLTNEVWLCIFGTLLISCVGLIGVIRGSEQMQQHKKIASGGVLLEVLGTLLGQGGLSDRLPANFSTRLLVLIWLFFAFIVGTLYKGNLVAFLVAPRYPPRPETLEELVKVVKRVTMPSFGDTLRELLRNSETDSLRSLGNMMVLGYDVDEGLRLTLQNKYPHLGSLRFLQYQVAEHYTEADGTSPLYLGREGVMPILNAWPIPHDAPFKEDLDFVILGLIEGGIYNKWMEDWLNEAKKVGRQSRRRQLEAGVPLESWTGDFPTEASIDSEPRALTIVHFQGPLMLLGFGMVFAGVAFIVESFVEWYSSAKAGEIRLRLKEQAIEKLF
ncbi:ionotropic receptor 21a-like [Macrobrachium nipponense]|uniref:ionotropic receptor 21a-like n=1 Tax=Macrobrachium nipponense TaxID=159736 RepID=UPI0030C83FED